METKRQQIVIGTLCSICIILWIIEQNISSQLYILTVNNPHLTDQIAFYKRENMTLRNELLSKESYHAIYPQAQKQGFIPAPTIIFLK